MVWRLSIGRPSGSLAGARCDPANMRPHVRHRLTEVVRLGEVGMSLMNEPTSWSATATNRRGADGRGAADGKEHDSQQIGAETFRTPTYLDQRTGFADGRDVVIYLGASGAS